MKLKSHKKKSFSTFISLNIIIFLISLSCSFFLLKIFAIRSNKYLFPLAKLQLDKAISFVINHSTDNLEQPNDLYSLDISNNEIKMINYNPSKVVKLLDTITFNIENDLRDIENNQSRFPEFTNGFYGEIPFGLIFNNVLLNNIGPKIKLKFKFLGSIISEVETEAKPYGINNAIIEMRIKVTVNGQIILPFQSEEVTISNVIPISINVVKGNVPSGYISSYK